MNTTTPMVILSAELNSLSDYDNTRRVADLRHTLRNSNIQWKEVSGTWKGKEEVSFLIILPWHKMYIAERFREYLNQESYLLIDSNSLASIEYGSSKESELLGKFTELQGKPMHEDYTLIGDKYYGIR